MKCGRFGTTTFADFIVFGDTIGPRSAQAMHHVGNPWVQQLFRRRLTERPLVSAMLCTTIAPTGVHGGYKVNVIPGEVEASLDCRVTVSDSGETLKRELEHVMDVPLVTIELTPTQLQTSPRSTKTSWQL